MAAWLRQEGNEVTEFSGDPGMFLIGYDVVACSVIFSWHAPIAAEIAARLKGVSEMWCGGPGMFALEKWWKETTGLDRHSGLDSRFDRQRGKFRMTFASRGCPVGCAFCIVPKLEGAKFTLDWDFEPAPILGDNNLSALPVVFQEHIIARYQASGVPLLDANSGFEPKTFDQGTFDRWSTILRGPWRFAFDEIGEAAEVEAMAKILHDVTGRKKRVYVLIGLEPFESCLERAQKVIEWGCEPFVQVFRPLTWLEDNKDPEPRFDWRSARELRDFQRYFNSPQIWRTTPLAEYRPRLGEPPPFRRAA